MIEQKSSLWGRLKICWNILTKKYYIYFGLDDDPIVWNEDGSYNGIKKKSLSAYSFIPYDYKFQTKDGITNLHDFVWGTIKDFATEAQKGKY